MSRAPSIYARVMQVKLLPAESGLILKMNIIFNMPFGQKNNKCDYGCVGKSFPGKSHSCLSRRYTLCVRTIIA